MTLVPWLLITAGLVVVILHQRVLDRRLARVERALKLRRQPPVDVGLRLGVRHPVSLPVARLPVVVGSLHQVLDEDWTPPPRPPQAWVQGHPVTLPPPPATRSLLTVKHLARLHTPLLRAGG